MKKLLLVSALLIFSLNAFCQDSGFVFGAYLTPSYSFRTLKSTGSGGADTLKKANAADQASGKVDFGIRLSANLSHHWKLTVGAAYATKGYVTNLTADTLKLGGGGSKASATIPQYNRYTFVEVPIYITYKMGDSAFNFGILAGIANSFLTQYIQDVRVYDNQVTPFSSPPTNYAYTGADLSNNNYSTYHISLLLGFEFSYRVSESFSIFAQPNFRYSFTNALPTNGLLDARLWNAGVSIGADYRF